MWQQMKIRVFLLQFIVNVIGSGILEEHIEKNKCANHRYLYNDDLIAANKFDSVNSTQCFQGEASRCTTETRPWLHINLFVGDIDEDRLKNGKLFTCISCDSSKDPTCATNTTFNVFEPCSYSIQKPQTCYHSINSQNIQRRGCTANLSKRMKTICEGNGEKCKTCDKPNCNSRSAFEKCYHCSASMENIYPNAPFIGYPHPIHGYNDMCITQEKSCTTFGDVCFSLITDDKTLVKDCLHEYAELRNLSINFLTENYKPSSYSVCSSSLCNDEEVKPYNCINCDSNRIMHCEHGPFTVAWTRYFYHTCPMELRQSGCYHYESLDEKYIERGCVAELKPDLRALCEERSNICEICVGNECNQKSTLKVTAEEKKEKAEMNDVRDSTDAKDFSEEFGKENSTDESDAEDIKKEADGKDVNESKDKDEKYKPGEKSKDKAKERDDNKITLKCKKDKKCFECDKSGCNDAPQVRRAFLSCVHCNKSEACGFGQDAGNATRCRNQVSLGTTETCYTNFNSDERWAERGCTRDLQANFDAKAEDTKICSNSGCNNVNVLHSYCISCTSDLNVNCAALEDPGNFMQQCNGSYPYEQRGCYELFRNNSVYRGCRKDLDDNDFNFCQSGGKSEICLQDGCNNNSVSSSTIRIAVNGLVVLSIIILQITMIKIRNM